MIPQDQALSEDEAAPSDADAGEFKARSSSSTQTDSLSRSIEYDDGSSPETPSDWTPDTSEIEDYQPQPSDTSDSPSTDEYEPSSSDSTDSSLTPEDEPALDDSSALTPSTETGTESVPQEEEEDSTAPSNSSPDPSAASPSADDSSQPSNDVQPTLATRSLAISDIDLDSLDDSFDGSFFDDPTLLLSKRSFVGVGGESRALPFLSLTMD